MSAVCTAQISSLSSCNHVVDKSSDRKHIHIVSHVAWESKMWILTIIHNCKIREHYLHMHYLFIWKKWNFVGFCVAFWSISVRKNYIQITHANHIDHDHHDYCKTKENVNIKLLYLCESLIVYILLNSAKESTWHWLQTDLISSWCKIVMRNFYKIILV